MPAEHRLQLHHPKVVPPALGPDLAKLDLEPAVADEDSSLARPVADDEEPGSPARGRGASLSQHGESERRGAVAQAWVRIASSLDRPDRIGPTFAALQGQNTVQLGPAAVRCGPMLPCRMLHLIPEGMA